MLMLRDQLAVGTHNVALSKKLQTYPDLKLERAKMMIRQKETERDYGRELQDDNTI